MSDPALFDVLVVGAGPGGLAAAAAAAESGAAVGLVDENSAPGGQIYRGIGGLLHPAVVKQIDALTMKRVVVLSGTTVFDAPLAGIVDVFSAEGRKRLQYRNLILAVGARELFVPFPGWTLPNVMGVGGLQALVKAGLNVERKRIVVAGSGPLLIAVAAYLKDHGAKVILIAEQASTTSLSRFMLSLAKYPTKVAQGAGLMRSVGTLIKRSTWVVRADGNHQLESVKLNQSAGNIACDYLACAYGFVPNLELPMLLGCKVVNDFVAVDALQKTSIENVFCAGEPTGIGGIDLSVVEGKISGYAATGQLDKAQSLFAERQKWQLFGAELDRTFALRDELKSLATPETVVCRCEDVTREQLSGWQSSRAAKLHTRCGMGSCQGRVCGPATRFLFGWEHGTVRSPLVPVPLNGLEISNQAAGNQTN